MSDSQNSNISEAARLLQTAVNLLQETSGNGRVRSTPTGNQQTSASLLEHRQLFSRNMQPRPRPYFNTRLANGPIPFRRENAGQSKRKTVKKVIVALAEKNARRAPSHQEKAILNANGLGERAVTFSAHGSASEMKSSLMSAFPKLEEGGGFEVLRTADNSRVELVVASVGPCGVDDLLMISTGRIYIRPIQNSIEIDSDKSTLISEDMEECLTCGSLIDTKQLRQHVKECKKRQNHGHASDEDDYLPDIHSGNAGRENNSSDYQTLRSSDTSDTVEVVELFRSEESNAQNSLDVNASRTVPEENPTSVEQIHVAEKPETVVQIIEKLKDIHDPVLILREYQKHFLTGRKLDITTETEMLEGETTNIFVSRERILETGFAGLLEPNLNFRIPLEVTFYGEEAQDVGGPRKEFFTLLLKELAKEENKIFAEEEEGQFVFTNNDHIIEKKWFYAAGLVCGLSIVQNGPLPTFIKNFDSVIENPTKSQKQFLEGLNEVGLFDVIKAKPCVRFLFQPTAKNDITLRKLKHLLQPKMKETGSNKRKQQEKIYEFFLLYLKEVAAGRRVVEKGKITLGDVLKFITGSEWEPVLGYTIQPRISFEEMKKGSLIPKSSTCINCLYLPVPGVLDPWPERSNLFESYDLAFCNTYFGLN